MNFELIIFKVINEKCFVGKFLLAELFFISHKSLSYVDVKSPTALSWAFLSILHVPRSLNDQCSTILLSSEQQ